MQRVLPLTFDSTAATTARRASQPILDAWCLNENTVYDALLVISELVTNAIEHASPPVRLHLRPVVAGGRPSVGIRVTDGGPAPSPGRWVASCAADEHGRGQAVVRALTTGPAAVGDGGWVVIDPS